MSGERWIPAADRVDAAQAWELIKTLLREGFRPGFNPLTGDMPSGASD